MNRVSFALLLSLVAFQSGCSKSVDREGTKLSATEPPSTFPIPGDSPSPSPTPIPSATPTPKPSVTPTPGPSPTPVAGCDPARLGELPNYAVYVKEELALEKVKVGRRVAAGDACIQHSQLGTDLAAVKTRTDLAIVHALDLNQTKIPNGRATYGSKLENTKSTALGGIVKASFWMTNDLKKIFDFSKACEKSKPNAEAKKTCISHGNGEKVCTVTIRGSHPTMNLAELDSNLVTGVQFYKIQVPDESTLVVSAPKVLAAKFSSTEVLFVDALVRAHGEMPRTVYWNFSDADRMDFDSTRFRGIVVAPDAKITVCGQAGVMGFWTRELTASDSNW